LWPDRRLWLWLVVDEGPVSGMLRCGHLGESEIRRKNLWGRPGRSNQLCIVSPDGIQFALSTSLFASVIDAAVTAIRALLARARLVAGRMRSVAIGTRSGDLLAHSSPSLCGHLLSHTIKTQLGRHGNTDSLSFIFLVLHSVSRLQLMTAHFMAVRVAFVLLCVGVSVEGLVDPLQALADQVPGLRRAPEQHVRSMMPSLSDEQVRVMREALSAMNASSPERESSISSWDRLMVVTNDQNALSAKLFREMDLAQFPRQAWCR